MKRSELTVKAMEEMGWEEVAPRTEPLIKDIVCAIKDGFYKYLRCAIDKSRTWTETDFEICATYKVSYCWEYLEFSLDNVEWHRVAKRPHQISRWCVYAD